MRKVFTILFFISLATGYSQSITPTVIASAGDHFSSATAQISWTLGETVIETVGSASAILTQGFHQSDLNANSVEEQSQQFSWNAFPNPTTGMVNLSSTQTYSLLECQLFTIDGKQIYSTGYNTASSFQIDMNSYPSGIYLLEIRNNEFKQHFTLIKQ